MTQPAITAVSDVEALRGELLPCPFCGGDAAPSPDYKTDSWRAACVDCGCSTPAGFTTPELVSVLWNTRTPIPVAVSREEVALPTYGSLPWEQLGRDVMEAATGVRDPFKFDEKFYPGHQSPGINFNSLARIVDKYRLSLPLQLHDRAVDSSNERAV